MLAQGGLSRRRTASISGRDHVVERGLELAIRSQLAIIAAWQANVLQSMLHRPNVIVATGNGWWTGGTSIAAIQTASTQSWASLFDVPLVMAFNR